MKFFEEMGVALERRWRAADYNESSFPQLAEEALAQFDAPKHVDPWDIVRWVAAWQQNRETLHTMSTAQSGGRSLGLPTCVR